jgi:hypothetical protein
MSSKNPTSNSRTSKKRNEGTNSSSIVGESSQVPKPLRVSNPPSLLNRLRLNPRPGTPPLFSPAPRASPPPAPDQPCCSQRNPHPSHHSHGSHPAIQRSKGPGRLNSRMKCRLNRTVEKGSGQQATVLGTVLKLPMHARGIGIMETFFAQLGRKGVM